MSEVLEVGSNELNHEPFAQYEIRSYSPYINSFNNNDVIRICLQHGEQYSVPNKSQIRVQGKVTQANGNPLIAGTSLVTNALSHLFSQAQYDLNSVTIDICKNVGITSIMKGYPSLSSQQLLSLEINGWDGTKIVDNEGNFDVLIPLSMIFGFAEDFQKIICNAKHEIILTRSNVDMNAIVQTAAAAASENNTFVFNIDKIEWLMPFIIPSDHNKLKLLKFLEKRPTLRIPFRSWELYEYPRLPSSNKHIWNVKTSNQLEKPRYVILGFQTGVTGIRTVNASEFKHCDVTNARLFLNSQYYPYINMNLNFQNNQYAFLYDMFLKFQCSYYGKHKSESIISRGDFKSKSPLIIFDCSCQTESIKFGPVDVRLEFESRVNIPDNTTAFCLIIHDRLVEYKPMEGDVRIITQ